MYVKNKRTISVVKRSVSHRSYPNDCSEAAVVLFVLRLVTSREFYHHGHVLISRHGRNLLIFRRLDPPM